MKVLYRLDTETRVSAIYRIHEGPGLYIASGAVARALPHVSAGGTFCTSSDFLLFAATLSCAILLAFSLLVDLVF